MIVSRIFVFQLSSFMIWSNSKTAPVNASTSPASTASISATMNLASRVEPKVTSCELYFWRLRCADTASWILKKEG